MDQHPLLLGNESIHDSGIIEDVHQESEDTGNEEYGDESNLESNLRRRKGKIISCVENASRLIRRRVPCAGHLMTPRRLWLNKIPTQCDVVIEFPEDAPDDALRWLLNKIKATPPDGLGLSTLVRAHDSTKRTAFYVTAPMNVLFKAAEEARLPKRLRTDLGGALKEFTKRESHCFAQTKDSEGANTLFTSQERQWLVLQVLQGLRAGVSDLKALQGRSQVEEGQSIVAAWQELGLITQVFPLHETSALQQLQSSWVRKFFAPQPLDDIAAYFGVKVALYFAWLGHYTCALCVPAVLGTILYAGLWGRGQTAQDIGHVIFSLFNVAWASLYLEAWRRYSVEMAFRWGTLSTPPELLEPPRPLYKGPLEESPVTGRLEPKETPAWQRRAFRYLVSFPIIGLCLVLVFVVMFLMLRLQDWLDQHLPNSNDGPWDCMCMVSKDWWDEKLPETGVFSCLSVIPKVLLAGAITLMDEAYYKLAVWLNDKENYRLQSKYENHLIAKVALFQFVNSFLSLFYIAFYLRDQDKLKEQLAGLLISRQIIGNLRESAWPYLVEQWKLAKLSFKMWGALSPTQELPPPTDSKQVGDSKRSSDCTTSTPKRSIGQAEIESSLYKYDGTFSDHLEMLVQMGYVVLFSAAFPLAGLCALANNLLEIRSDAFKLAHVHQRPFGQRVANIGTWQNALGMLGLAAVIVNCALIGLSGQVSRLWPGLTSTQTVILIVALEHVMLGLRSALTWLLPELPSWLAAEIARAEHCRREMQCKGTSPRQSPPSPPSSTSLSHHDQDFNSNQDLFGKTEQSVGRFHISSSHDNQANDLERVTLIDVAAKLDNLSSRQQQSHPQSPHQHQHILQQQQKESRSSSDHIDIFGIETREVTPESPISQTSTVLLRPAQDSPLSGQSAQTVALESTQSNTGACPKKPSIKLAEIPPYRGESMKHSYSIHDKRSINLGETMSPRISSPPIQIPEIPPFRKQAHSTMHSPVSQSPLANASPPRIAEIPPFRPRNKSKEWMPNIEHTEHHLTIGPSGGAEWAKRLKAVDPSIIHRSTDCIVAKHQELATGSDSELLKAAPSWNTMVPKVSEQSGTSTSAPSVKAQTEEEDKAAAELAAKKSRLKQSLVKRARSVAIFSLKLKEQRAKRAEKAAQEARDALPAPPPGGELSLIPIEQLIQVDDVLNQLNLNHSRNESHTGNSSSSTHTHSNNNNGSGNT
ncbi:anoctamin-8 isoform X3 [Toxorhynchites rutilus septentrionalis]|uniref:anoctamin-8 isoform X3 n=1 Tax=Toxorhynchites rutilus septentrionalis TaxID=329112 RepID=UPI00247A62C2|nr:anoctamin-8 isoform X3 [Toxorhynchites rutilus septentrionalis]